MSQFLYNLANEPSIGLYHVNDHVRRTVPRLVTVRKDIDHQKVEMDKSSCDVDEILPTVRTISGLESFKSIKSILTRSIQLASPKPPGSRSLGPPTPTRTPASISPNTSMRNIDTSQIVAQTESLRVPPSIASNEPLNDQKSTSTPSATHSAPEEPEESTVETTRSRSTEVETVSDSITTADQPSESTEIAETNEASTASESVLEPTRPEQESFSLAVAESSSHPQDVPDAAPSEPAVEPIETPAEPKLSHEEMILGARAHSSKKKKGAKGKSDNLVPKNF
jgi:hypothetical protein